MSIEIPEGTPWYVPSYLGDVRLEALSGKRTRVLTSMVTATEKKALSALETYALKKKWVETWPAWRGVELPEIVLTAPVDKVASVLAKALKPGRRLVSAVRFEGGKMVEVAEADLAEKSTSAPPSEGPYREPSMPTPVKEVPKPKAATTVAAPIQGCPAPDFAKAEVKVRAVLAAFLSPRRDGGRAPGCRFR